MPPKAPPPALPSAMRQKGVLILKRVLSRSSSDSCASSNRPEDLPHAGRTSRRRGGPISQFAAHAPDPRPGRCRCRRGECLMHGYVLRDAAPGVRLGRARRASGALCFVCGVRAQHAVATRAYTHCSPSFPLYPSLPNHPSLLSRISPTHSFILNLGTRNQQTTPRTHARTIRPGRGFTPMDRGEPRTTLARRTPLPRATRPSSSSIFRTFPASSPSYRSSKTSTST